MNKTCDAKLQMHLLEIEITTKCNLNCRHCYNRGYQDMDMPLNTIIDLLKFAEEYNVNTLVISGGEACIHPEFKELCKYLKNNRPNVEKIVIQSNGYIKNIDFELLKAFDTIHLSFELDGSDVRKFSGYDVVNTAKKLKDYGIYSYLFSTIHAKNIDSIDTLTKIANDAMIDIGFNICCDTGKNKDLLLTQEQKMLVSKKFLDLHSQGKILKFSHPFTSIIANRSSDEFIGIRGGCSAGIAACDVLPNGDVIPCPFFRTVAGNIYNNSLKDIWLNSDFLRVLRGRKYLKGNCHNCKHLSFCGGCRKVAFEQTGDLLGSDPSCFKNLYENS